MAREVIFTVGDFSLVHESSIGREDTPLEGLKVISDGLAEKHVVEVRLDSDFQSFNGEPVKYMYYNIYIAHGMRMKSDTIEETKEYIQVLQDAIEFAKKVEVWCKENNWWKD